MTTTTRKHRALVAKLMWNKPVTDLPGIREKLGKNLKTQGFTRASAVLGHYLQMRKDPDRFRTWLQEAIGATPHKADCCTQALEEWCTTHL